MRTIVSNSKNSNNKNACILTLMNNHSTNSKSSNSNTNQHQIFKLFSSLPSSEATVLRAVAVACQCLEAEHPTTLKEEPYAS